MFTQKDDALHAVKTLAFQRTSFGLASSYKGMLFNEKVQPMQVGMDYVIFKSPSPKICLILGETVYLYSHVLPETVRATPQLVSRSSCELRLTDFAYTGTLWFDRLEQRVQPEGQVYVDMLFNHHFYRAVLKDISANGIGLLVQMSPDQQADIITNTPIDFNFELDAHDHYTLHGTVVHRRSISPWLVDVGLRVFTTPTQKARIENFLGRRKMNILAEIERSLKNSLEPQEIKDQYF